MSISERSQSSRGRVLLPIRTNHRGANSHSVTSTSQQSSNIAHSLAIRATTPAPWKPDPARPPVGTMPPSVSGRPPIGGDRLDAPLLRGPPHQSCIPPVRSPTAYRSCQVCCGVFQTLPSAAQSEQRPLPPACPNPTRLLQAEAPFRRSPQVPFTNRALRSIILAEQPVFFHLRPETRASCRSECAVPSVTHPISTSKRTNAPFLVVAVIRFCCTATRAA